MQWLRCINKMFPALKTIQLLLKMTPPQLYLVRNSNSGFRAVSEDVLSLEIVPVSARDLPCALEIFALRQGLGMLGPSACQGLSEYKSVGIYGVAKVTKPGT